MSSGSPSHFTVDQSGCQPQLLPIHSANSTIQPPTCLLCDWIILRVTIQPWVTLMNLEIRSTDLNNSPCKRHSNISKAIKEYSKHLTSGRLVIVATKPNQFEFSHWERHSLLFILSLKEAESQPLSETAIIDPHWICASDMTDWKSNCQMKHATICSDLELRSSFRPNLVIDTWEMCLKRIDNEARFVALSYLWGNTPTFTTITSNVHDLQRPGALNVPAVLERLPQTIQDAIKLTPILKERYLWVDSLCIIQDDQLNSSHEINNMSSVYANACVTIVAANGDDSSYGLRGIKGVSKERNTSESTFSFTPHYTASITPSRPHIRLEETRWQQRGWTFQENLFSARKLIFANERVNGFISSGKENKNIIFNLTWPNLYMYNLLVKDYQVTELTFQEDVLHAFAGITTRLCSSFAGGFNYGISELFFDDGLLWQPNGSMARRFGVNARGEDTPLPSWSWMGWHVQMDQLSIQRGCEYMKRSSLGSFDLANIHKLSTQQRTTTLVQWYILKKFTNQKRAISNNSKQYLYCLEENAELPSGWRRHKTLPQPLLPLHHPTQIHPYFVDHERLQGAQVWYPIPLVGSDAVPSLQEQSHLLWCHTQRAWLTAHYVPFTRNKWLPARKMQEIFYSTLKDETGSWAGILTMHEEVITGEQGISCEFVAISKGYCSKASDTYDLEECRWDWLRFEDENQPYEWYNVLWVEWVDGVAYRKGLGRVPKEVWERQDLEWIDLTLG